MLLENRIPLRYVAANVWSDAASVLAIAGVVELLVWFDGEMLPDINLAIPSFLGTTISLLLSFKLSQSYDRWWEARKIWGAVVNDSRSLARQVLTFPTERRNVLAVQITRRQIAWCYSLGQSLRGLDWLSGARAHLSEADAREAANSTNRPLALLQQQADDVASLCAEGVLTDYQRVTIDDTLRRLTDSMGQAERIRNTVFPRTYRMFLHVFIYLFITSLSVALGEVSGAWQALVTTAIAIPFFLLEKTALHMQDPFQDRPTDTPVTAIARTIEINLLQLLGCDDVPEPLQPEGYYLM